MSAVKRGDHGQAVEQLQEGLNSLGFELEVDGHFGDATHNAVITVQSIFGYTVDGVAGPATLKLIHAQAGYGWNLVAARKAFVKGTAGA